MNRLTISRRRSRNLARLGAVGSAAMLVFSVVGFLGADAHAVDAINSSGAVTLALSSGPGALTNIGSATGFSMSPPSGAACPGSGGGTPAYKFQTFMVTNTVDPGTLQYIAGGPKPVTGAVALPFYSAVGDPVVNQNPQATPLGQITSIPELSFGWATPVNVPAGNYKVGIACTQAGNTVSYWFAKMTVTTAAADTPGGFTWSLDSSVDATTTTVAPTTTTTTIAATTTTRANVTTTTTRSTATTVGATTTTVAGATTTTVIGSTTTVASAPGTTTTSASSGCVACSSSNPQAGSLAPTGQNGTLANTGSSPLPIIIWALLLLVFGRMAILLARPLRVRTPGSR